MSVSVHAYMHVTVHALVRVCLRARAHVLAFIHELLFIWLRVVKNH